MDVQLPRGMRDFALAEKIARDKLIALLREQFERYGFNPLETPVLERYDVLSSKYAGGAEILKETFRLVDQGERELGLRYDLTVPLARFIAMHPDVKMPFKRYAIGTVYRDGPIKLGRYREFVQCDCDIVGADSAAADAQCIQLALGVFGELGMPFQVTMNHVGLLRHILMKEDVPEEQLIPAMLVLDKLKKIGEDGVRKELSEAGIPTMCVDGLLAVTNATDVFNAVRSRYGDHPGLTRLQEVAALVHDSRLVFDPTLSRGLSYYTGIVFETYLLESQVTSSVSAGGRYDRMIGEFLEKPEGYPAVGISFGLEPITEAIKLTGQEGARCVTTLYVIPIKTHAAANDLVQRLRAQGVRADLDLIGRGISKNLDYANAQGIPYVAIIGPQELQEGKIKLKDMRSGEERMLAETELADAIR